MEMTSRKEKILSSVVRDYIISGEPVGSKAIADEIGVSSATVRNEMAELIELGLLEQPHTSAGRIPSQKGYREYVDHLMRLPSLGEREKQYFDSVLLANAHEPERLLSRVCKLLSESSKFLSLATSPGGDASRIKAVQFVQTSRRTAMILLMGSAGTIKSRVFHCDFDLTGDMMRVFFRSFNEKLAGKEVSEVTPAFLQSMAVSMGEMYVLAAPALQALYEAAQDTLDTDLFLGGQMNLLRFPELEHRSIMELLERKSDVGALLQGKPGKATALIGKETGWPELRNVSLLAARYTVDGQNAGALALLGPTRMDYAGLMAVLEYLTEEVGKLLTVLTREE